MLLTISSNQAAEPFHPGDRPNALVLRSINLKINKGRYVAFVGTSGCGKSTVIAMPERFYDLVRGHPVLDGKNLDKMNLRAVREEVALVQQEPKVYPGTIRKNIAMGASNQYASSVSEDNIIRACRSANA
ncbi:ABC transporter [Fusarium flagelliforme]|uniref:ABC transporter n=1 Tax=Fusarium flagelliforme TaxID=2675880 RepID=A0A395M6X6_9HYPO|nr:ABC transporter [Fusarium flagelliforme]